MNYEEFYASLSPLGSNLKASANSVSKYQKMILRDADTGNLSDMRKCLDALKEASAALEDSIDAYENAISGFDVAGYFESGDFARQLLSSCEEKGVDVKGEKGIYEMFPFKIRISSETQEVYMNRKKLQSCRPSYIAETVHVNQDKLNKALFKTGPFLSELADAYEITCLRSGARIGSSQMLTKIYKSLVPMSRARKEYDMQAFAFDLARLYEAGPEEWIDSKTGQHYTFGTSRDGKSGIRVLGKTGVETYILTFSMINTAED